jgi:hypothetical protein
VEGDVTAILLALGATGAGRGEALALAARTHGWEAVLPFLTSPMGLEADPDGEGAFDDLDDLERDSGAAAVAALNAVAAHDPDMAQAGLMAWGRDRVLHEDLILSGESFQGLSWIRALPPGLEVGGDLDLRGCGNLAALPDGLAVGCDLWLGFCVALKSLPSGLRVGGDLVLEGATGILGLPGDLILGGDLILDHGCPLHRLSERKFKAMAPGFEGGMDRW